MFGGYIPEEPRPGPDDGYNADVKLPREKILAALKDGTVSLADVDRAAGHVLYEMEQFGYLDGQSKHEVTRQSVKENAEVIEKTGEESAVLLKNDDRALPLKAADLNSVVLIGPTAAQIDAIGINGERFGGSAGTPDRSARSYEKHQRQRQHPLCGG